MWSLRSRQSKYMKAGNEPFRVRDKTVGFTIFDYWRWAHSDLLDNAARGVLAEFLVVRALNYTLALNYTYEPRHEWDATDVRTESGLKVEVKSAAYAQTWAQNAPSKISFDIAPRSREWNAKTDEYETYEPPKRIADVYVFCLLGQPDDPCPDPMDLDQWEFYVARQGDIGPKASESEDNCSQPAQVTRATGDRKMHDAVWRVAARHRDVG